MSFLSRHLPGGLFPRLVALFPLLFPLYVMQGVFFGVPVTLPEVFLLAMAFFFLFEHESFRFEEWKLWPVFCFLGFAILILCFGSFEVFEILKSWTLFPLLFFVMARSVFREKPYMVVLAQGALILSSALLSIRVLWAHFSPDSGFLVPQTLSLTVAPGFILAIFMAIHARSKWSRVFGIAGAGLSFFALFFYPPFFQEGLSGLSIPEWFLLTPFLKLLFVSLGISVVWMGVQALAWLRERDLHRRFAVAYAFLCFLVLLCFHLPFLTVNQLFLFWLFMAILL